MSALRQRAESISFTLTSQTSKSWLLTAWRTPPELVTHASRPLRLHRGTWAQDTHKHWRGESGELTGNVGKEGERQATKVRSWNWTRDAVIKAHARRLKGVGFSTLKAAGAEQAVGSDSLSSISRRFRNQICSFSALKCSEHCFKLQT